MDGQGAGDVTGPAPAPRTTTACGRPAGAAPDAPAARAPWPAVLTGRLVLRVCPSGTKDCAHDGCHLRVLCQCAKAELDRAAVIEQRLWVVLLICGVGALVYWILWA
jgi:hypothetical protein